MTDDLLAPKRRLPERPSQLAERKAFPRLVAREDLERRLRVHDPHDGDEAIFGGEDFDLMRQIALESNASEPDLWVRRNAISMLASEPSPENLNVLTLLARANPDVNVRAEAVSALGRTGVVAVAAVLAEALGARDSMESIAARRALQHLAAVAGTSAVVAGIPGNDGLARRVSEALEPTANPEQGKARSTGADKVSGKLGAKSRLTDRVTRRKTR